MDRDCCRLLPMLRAAGPMQMGADEVLLDAAARGQPALRFYEWAAPTLSLGYFQSASDRLHWPSLVSLDWLRRPTGGGAIVHDRELTYALAVPSEVVAGARFSLPLLLHSLLAEVLRDLGVVAEPATSETGRGEFLCFSHHTAGDLLIGSSKIVGSAQRRRNGAILTHGSILLAASSHTPELPGIAELSGQAIDPQQLAEQWATRIGQRLLLVVRPDDWTDEELAEISRIAGRRYSAPEWNERR